jgi:hypothetical protein
LTHEILPNHDKPPTLAQTLGLGRVLAASGFFADTRGAAQAVVKIQAGREMGFGPIASMTGVNIIRGRITIGANLMAAAIRRSRRYDYRIRKHTDLVCEIEFQLDGQPIGTSSFTMEDARRAGLAHGENWKKYPRNMLFAWEMSNGAKWHCPDVFGGPVYLPDELGAVIDGETGEMISPPSSNVIEPAAVPSDSQSAGSLGPLLRRKGIDLARFFAHFGAEELDDLTEAQRREAFLRLEDRPDVKQPTEGMSPEVGKDSVTEV